MLPEFFARWRMSGKGRCETRVLEKNWKENDLYEKIALSS
jgi:hypothetical protein